MNAPAGPLYDAASVTQRMRCTVRCRLKNARMCSQGAHVIALHATHRACRHGVLWLQVRFEVEGRRFLLRPPDDTGVPRDAEVPLRPALEALSPANLLTVLLAGGYCRAGREAHPPAVVICRMCLWRMVSLRRSVCRWHKCLGTL